MLAAQSTACGLSGGSKQAGGSVNFPLYIRCAWCVQRFYSKSASVYVLDRCRPVSYGGFERALVCSDRCAERIRQSSHWFVCDPKKREPAPL